MRDLKSFRCTARNPNGDKSDFARRMEQKAKDNPLPYGIFSLVKSLGDERKVEDSIRELMYLKREGGTVPFLHMCATGGVADAESRVRIIRVLRKIGTEESREAVRDILVWEKQQE